MHEQHPEGEKVIEGIEAAGEWLTRQLEELAMAPEALLRCQREFGELVFGATAAHDERTAQQMAELYLEKVKGRLERVEARRAAA